MIDAWKIYDEFIAGYCKHGRAVLLFDYDGTLVPIAEHPWLARLSRTMRRLLERLADRPGMTVGIASGRALDDLKETVSLKNVHLAGTGGLELDLCGVHVVHPKAKQARQTVTSLVAALRIELARHPHARLEEKGLGLTVHYRHVPPEEVEPLRWRCDNVLRRFSGQVQLRQGPMAIELIPDLGWNKGTAVRMILAHVCEHEAALLYAGDSSNDDEGLKVVAELGGIALGIGPDAPAAARYRLRDPAELESLLANLDEFFAEAPSYGRETPRRHPLAVYGLWRPLFPANPM